MPVKTFCQIDSADPLRKREFVKPTVIAISAFVLTALMFASSMAITAQEESNPVKEKFEQDLKDAVTSESITVAQLKDIQANLATLKEAKANQQSGAPVDLMTPFTAVSQIRATMATVKEPARDTLRQDFQLMMATKQPPPSTEQDTPGKKLGKDIFSAVMHGEPTPAQVQQLQQSLNSLESIKTSSEGGLQKLRTLRQAKTDIAQTMNAGDFRPADRQIVLDDLNNLGPQGGRGRGGL
jgi:hypothetical protein